jgi:ABC-type bacteriocin/lantibiotic exporter with double-glycine peptidase domain
MKKLAVVKQRDLTDCGAACLASVFGYYGCHLPISQIRISAGTDRLGTNILGMLEAATAFHFQAKAVKGTMENLPLIPLPSIVHVTLPGGLQHYLVIEKIKRKNIRYMDPADGKFHWCSNEYFHKVWTGVIIMLSPMADFRKLEKSMPVVSRFIMLVNPHKFELLQAFAGSVVYTILGFSTAIYLQKLVDDVIENENISLLHFSGIIMVLLLMLQLLIGLVRSLIGFRMGQVIDARLITGYFRHLFSLPQQFFDTMRVGEIISRINDAIKIRLFINDIALGIMINSLIVLFSAAFIFLFYWKLAFLLFSAFPVYFCLYRISIWVNRKWQRKLMEQSADLESNLVESLQAATTIKRLGLEPVIFEKMETVFFRLMNSSYKAGLYNLYTGLSGEFLNRALTISLLWIGAWLVIQKDLTPGELLSFYSLIAYFTGPAAALSASGKVIQDAFIAADRLFEIIDLDKERMPGVPSIHLRKGETGDIYFSEVSFRYGTRINVFDGLSMRIKKAEITAIVGESGSGKSTILSLVQYLYPVNNGQITIAGIPIQQYDLNSLRKIIAVVPQQIDIFSGSLLENITIGDPTPDLEKVIRICKSLDADSFIDKLPDGYLAKLGERGIGLSGGQKQKLAIARALYRDPEILVLDEPSSNLDLLSEDKLRQVISRLKKEGKTIIIITHRLSIIQQCDVIHVLGNNRLQESGRHEELIDLKGKYFDLWRSCQL